MRRDFDKPLLDYAENVVKEKEAIITMKSLAMICINGSDDKDSTGAEKARKFALAIKIHKGGVIELDAEEMALLNQLADKVLNTLSHGRYMEFLNTDYAGEKLMVEKPAVETKTEK